jgi:hypothetical protein
VAAGAVTLDMAHYWPKQFNEMWNRDDIHTPVWKLLEAVRAHSQVTRAWRGIACVDRAVLCCRCSWKEAAS